MRFTALLIPFVTTSIALAQAPTAVVTFASRGPRRERASERVGERVSERVGDPAPLPVPAPTRAVSAPHIDGLDTDDLWRTATIIDAFRQWEPIENGDPSFKTEARIAYDARNLYVIVRMYDPHPDSLLSVLQRRDGMALSDDIILGVDSYHDKRTGYMFRLTPAGTMSDGYMFNDGNEDWGWNAVWEGATHVDSLGWTAEYRIPLSQLRYVPSGDNTFGIMVMRRIARKGERLAWPLFRRSKTGMVSQWAEMPGFAGLSAPRRMELLPYSVAKYGASPKGDGTPRNAAASQIGADVKLGLTSNITLDAAVNPDFGQVEADPGVLNLTAFEPFFAERRPFFLEGVGIFRYDIDCNDGQCTGLFYSRRIGRAPQLRNTYGDAASPLQSRILGAAKVTGRLGNGLSVGLLDAVTGEARGVQQRTIEPQTNYAVVRLQQDLRGGNSGVGLMLTNTARQTDQWTRDVLRDNAWTGGLDARHRFAGNRWQLTGQLSGSHVSGTAQAIALTQRSNVHLYQRPDATHLRYDSTRTNLMGWFAAASVEKQGGGLTRSNTSVWYMTPGYEINDLGFRTRADEMGASTWVGLMPVKPVGKFRRGQLNFNGWMTANTSGLVIGSGGNTNAWGEFKNFWSANGGIGVNNVIPTYSDRDARGGPALFMPPRVNLWANLNGDSRKTISPSLGLNGGRRVDGLGGNWNVSLGMQVRLGTQFNGSINAGYGRNINDQQWNGNFVDGGVTSYTFARLYQNTSSVTARMNYTITPTLSVESYLQPFVATGTFTNWRALADGRSRDVETRFRPYTTRGAPGGFRFGQLRTNNVVRWEYRPGSTLFFVWSQGRDASDDGSAGAEVGRAYSQIFSRRPDNVFLVKASYWLGR
ncbi:MAG: carbohydrate binding family 9 domain-containing protein [Gemmatimonadaceae bacterium]|nr:carbohydrate binding family 9 domain-containing protein [Gemmatimonadaceae bacterium]